MADHQSQPLIPPNKQPGYSSISSSGVTSNAILALGALRVVVGAACLAAPVLTCSTFFIDLAPEGVFLTRLVGARELTIGGLLLRTRSRAIAASAAGPAGSTVTDLRNVLWANLVTDSVDIVSCLIGELSGSIRWEAAALFGGGAAAFVTFALVGLKGL